MDPYKCLKFDLGIINQRHKMIRQIEIGSLNTCLKKITTNQRKILRCQEKELQKQQPRWTSIFQPARQPGWKTTPIWCLPERCASLGIMGDNWGPHWKPSHHQNTIALRGLRGTSIGIPWCREMSLTANIFLSCLVDRSGTLDDEKILLLLSFPVLFDSVLFGRQKANTLFVFTCWFS